MRAGKPPQPRVPTSREAQPGRTSVRYAQRVQVRQRQHNLSGVHARQRLLKQPSLVELEEEVAAVHEIHDEIQLRGRLQPRHQARWRAR